jgi:hypothetical protein
MPSVRVPAPLLQDQSVAQPVAFTIGMCYQVSGTTGRDRRLRRTVLFTLCRPRCSARRSLGVRSTSIHCPSAWVRQWRS